MQSEEQKAARRAYKAAYYKAHKAEYAAYAQAHKEKWREGKREYDRSERGKAVRTFRRRSLGIPERIRIPKLNVGEFRAKKAAYARMYRQTPKGREVNRVGQAKIHSKRIEAEGSHTTQEWIDIKAKYGDRCLCCGRHESELKSVLEEDHVIPLSRGGTNWINNIQPLCEDCNGMGGKGTKTTDYRVGNT